MVRIQVLEVPYDSGHRDARHGAGPSALLRGGAAERLGRSGATVDVVAVDLDGGFTTEIGSGVEVMRRVARAVTDAGAAATVVLAGNCGATVGVMAAHASAGRRVGVLWLDGHGDLQTPETTTSGFFDGTALALLTGRCWRALAATIPGFVPVPEDAVVLVGGHDLDPAEEQLLASSATTWLSPTRLRTEADALHDVVVALAARVDALHVHIDLDVLDTSVGRANGYATSGGLQVEELRAVLRAAAGRLPVVSATLASWDPALDLDGGLLDVALVALEDIGTMLATSSADDRLRTRRTGAALGSA